MKIKKILLVVVFTFMMILNVKATDIQLEKILIDGAPLEGFNPELVSYNIDVPSDKESITIGYEFDQNQYNVSTNGSSTIALKYGNNVFTITISSKENSQETRTYTLNIMRKDGRSNDNTLASLIIAGKKVQIYNDKFNYDVEVDNTLKKVEVKATTSNSKAKFVQGYGERIGTNAVTLSNGERTVIEIKVKAENDAIQTYTITIIKGNYKSNDATLKSLTIEEKNFNFNPDILKYNIEVENEVDKINLEAIPNHDKAQATYDKEIELKEGINNIIIKVLAEDGTSKEYTLNITRKAEIALVSDIEVEGIDLNFDPDVYEYELDTSLTTLNFKVTLSNETATYDVLNNTDLKDGSIVKIIVQDKNKKLTYNFKIISSKDETGINGAGTSVGGSSFFKKYEMYIGLITFGVGLLSLLIAILKKTKGSQIM